MRFYKTVLVLMLVWLTGSHATGQNLDLRILQHINGPQSRADGFWRGVSTSDYVVVAATPVSMLAVGLAEHNNDLKTKALETGGALVLSEGITTVLKHVVKRERPYLAHPDLIYGKSNTIDSSFPSGHTSTAFATATSLSMAFPKWYVIAPSFAYAGAVGYSRMYLGVHYPSDVLTGAAIGIGSALLSFQLQLWLQKKPAKR